MTAMRWEQARLYGYASVVWTRWLFGVQWSRPAYGGFAVYVYLGPLVASLATRPKPLMGY